MPPSSDYAFLFPRPVGVRHQYYPNWSPSRLSAIGLVSSGEGINETLVISDFDYNARFSQVLGRIPISANISAFDLNDPRHVWIPWATSSVRTRWDRPFQPQMGRFSWHGRGTLDTTRPIPANDSFNFMTEGGDRPSAYATRRCSPGWPAIRTAPG